MYELIQAGENSYYIQSPTKIGLVRTGTDEVCLIDSGNDKDAGKKVKRILDEHGWTLRAIYNTHSHADHIGGNRFLQEKTGCAVYAPGIERDFTEHPILEPSFLYSGYPPKDLRHKFLMAQGCAVRPLIEDALPDGWQMIPLPGHSFDMVGFRTQDDVVYLADCLAGAETLAKYQISFLTDPEAYIRTLEKVRETEAALFIPAHAEAVKDIAPLAQMNIDKVKEIAGKILELCREPVIFEDLLKQLFDFYALTMSFEQYVLVGCTVRSYLSMLRDSGRIQPVFSGNRLLWQRV